MFTRRSHLPSLDDRAGASADLPSDLHLPRPRYGRAFWPLWVAAIGVPLLGFTAGAAWSWHTVQAETRARLVRTVDLLHAHALRAFETREALLTAAQERSRDMTWQEIAGSASLDAFLRSLATRASWISALGMVAPDGRMVQITTAPFPPAVQADFSDRDYVRAHRDGAYAAPTSYVGQVIVSRVGDRVVVPISRARLDSRGEPDGGVIWATFRPADATRFFASIVESADDTVMLLRSDGSILARYPALVPPEERALPEGSAPMLAIRGTEQSGDVAIRLGASALEDGKERIYAARRIAGYPVSIVYGLHAAGPRAQWLGEIAVLGLATGAAALLLLWLTYVAANQARRETIALETARREGERRLEAETRMRHAERIGALGRVAAGVAHDMNNVVQSMLSAAKLLQRRAAEPEEVRRIASLAEDAASRGARIAARMLRFSRPVAPTHDAPLDLGESLAGLEELLTGLLGAGVQLRCTAAPALPPVRLDRGEFETVLVNLAVNARDAMPRGGEVSIEAGHAPAPSPVCAEQRIGPWVRIAVRDSGEGMTPEVLARAGEPFFTTKPEGRGTGLGLAMARQFAERAGGALRVESAPGAGTTVTLLLPAEG